MRATKAWGSASYGRVGCRSTLAVGALPILVLSLGGSASAATQTAAAGCTPGSGVHLVGKRLTDTELQSYSENGQLRCADLARANLSGLSLIQDDLTGANLRKANLSGADLGQATLSHAQLQGAKMAKVDLTQGTLIGTNFSGANARSAKFGQATMTGANLSKAILISADFGEATISKANFTKANLTKASFTAATANGTNFKKANLTDAEFTSATLTGAHFNGAKLAGVDFTGATDPPKIASGSGGPSSLPGIGNNPTVSGPPIDKGQWQSYLLIGSAVLFALMAAASVRRFFSARVRTAFLNRGIGAYGGYGLGGGSYGPYNQGGSYGPAGSYGPYSQGGGFNAGFGTGPTGPTGPTGSGFDSPPGGGYGPMPGVGGPGGALGGGFNPTARPFRLVLALIGAFVTAAGIWWLGTAVMNAVLVPVGSAYQLCESTCSTRFSSSVTISIVVGVVIMIVGGILRRIGTVRFYY